MRRRARWLARLIATAAVLHTAYAALVRPWHLRWGATEDEVRRRLPGDETIGHPTAVATRAVTVHASAAEIWPWLVQMGGYDRAGWYAYDRFDNAGRPSADRVIPELQDLRVGDVMKTSPRGGFTVTAIDPGRSLVLSIESDAVRFVVTCALAPVGARETRLIMRIRTYFAPRIGPRLFGLIFDPGDFVFMRKQMLGIRERAERSATTAADR